MEQNIVNVIEKLAAAVGKTGGEIVHYYVTWYIVASIVWGLFGAMIIFLGTRIKGNENELIRWILFIIGLLFFCSNLIDLLAPQGIAIHQIIKDLRGEG